jgi:hypothetical protein
MTPNVSWYYNSTNKIPNYKYIHTSGDAKVEFKSGKNELWIWISAI